MAQMYNNDLRRLGKETYSGCVEDGEKRKGGPKMIQICREGYQETWNKIEIALKLGEWKSIKSTPNSQEKARQSLLSYNTISSIHMDMPY